MRGLDGHLALFVLALLVARAGAAPSPPPRDRTHAILADMRVTYRVVTVAGKWRRPARRGYGGCTLSVIQQRGGDSNACPDEVRYAKATAAIFHVTVRNNGTVPPPRLLVQRRHAASAAAAASSDKGHPSPRWPDEEGLVRLLCGSTLFESVDDTLGATANAPPQSHPAASSSPRSGFERPPRHLFSLPSALHDVGGRNRSGIGEGKGAASLLTSLLQLEAEESCRELQRSGFHELLRLGLVLNYTSDTENTRAGRRWVLPGTIGDQCRLRFLPRSEQLCRPGVDLLWEQERRRETLAGTIPSHVSAGRTVADLSEHLSGTAAAARAFTDNLQETIFEPPAFRARTMIREEPLSESDRRATLETIAQETGRRRPSHRGGGGLVLESEFLETEASAQNPAMGMISAPLNGIISGAMAGIIPVAVGPLSAAIAPAVAPGATEISSKVADLLKPALTLELSTSMPDVLMEALPDSVTEAVSEAAAHVMTDGLTETMGNSLSHFLVDSLTQHITLEATELMSHKISQRLTKTLTATLGRSVSHALVPSLVHTVSHNPLMDYYCYYCFYKKMYCSYCQYAPSQLYYTMFYTGYYSMYYSQYYADMSPLATERKRRPFRNSRSDSFTDVYGVNTATV